MSDWQNRIKRYGTQAADQFLINPSNARKHPEKQRKAVKGSLDTLGWVSPVILNATTGYLVDGHERVWQALSQGDDTPVPFIEIELDEHEERQFLLTFDYITHMAEFDKDMVEALMHEVNSDNEAIQQLMADMANEQGIVLDDTPALDPEAQINLADELQKKWGTERGQVWLIPSKSGNGVHKVMCGDSTSAEDVAKLMDGKRADMMVTDPPYGVEYDANWRNDVFGEGDRATGKVTNDDISSWDSAWELAQTDIVYCWHADQHASNVERGLKLAGYEIRAQIIWSKPHFVVGRGHYSTRHEPCWYAVRKGRQANWIGADNEQTIWDIKLDERADGGHSTQKPIECMARPIRNHLANSIYDPFLGSGTTLVACEQTGRVGYGMEISPQYLGVILERMSAMGLTPILQDGS